MENGTFDCSSSFGYCCFPLWFCTFLSLFVLIKIKNQSGAAVVGIVYPTALSVTAPYPVLCKEAGGAGAEPPQNLLTAAAPVQTVLPLEWSGQKRGAGL